MIYQLRQSQRKHKKKSEVVSLIQCNVVEDIQHKSDQIEVVESKPAPKRRIMRVSSDFRLEELKEGEPLEDPKVTQKKKERELLQLRNRKQVEEEIKIAKKAAKVKLETELKEQSFKRSINMKMSKNLIEENNVQEEVEEGDMIVKSKQLIKVQSKKLEEEIYDVGEILKIVKDLKIASKTVKKQPLKDIKKIESNDNHQNQHSEYEIPM